MYAQDGLRLRFAGVQEKLLVLSRSGRYACLPEIGSHEHMQLHVLDYVFSDINIKIASFLYQKQPAVLLNHLSDTRQDTAT